jgi:hypothetical protein
MRARWGVVGLVVAVAAASFLGAGNNAGDAARLASGCKTNYDYAGVQNVRPAAGIRTVLTNIREPDVTAGHVAGWVGVGGPGKGPNGTDEWLQIGYVGLPQGQPGQIYYEVTQPHVSPQYHTVQATLAPGAKNLITVSEVSPDTWQASVDNTPVTPPIALPGSDGRFPPQATGETWNAGSATCNVYGYSLGSVTIEGKVGGTWKNGKAGFRFHDSQQQLHKTSSNSFTARSSAAVVATTADSEPPLLGHGYLASKLLGRKVQVHCVRQSQPARQPPDTLLMSTTTCATLIGYAVAQPRAPKAGTATGLQVATTAFTVLRVTARMAGATSAQTDCNALKLFDRALHGLGATPREASALRAALLQQRSQVSPALTLQPSCPIH